MNTMKPEMHINIVDLYSLGSDSSSGALRAARALLAHNTLQTRHALETLVASGAAVALGAWGARGSDLYDHLGVLGLHLALPLHKICHLRVELLLLRAQLRST